MSNIHLGASVIGLGLLAAYLLRWSSIVAEDRRIRTWQKLPSEEQPPVLFGYHGARGKQMSHRLLLFGVFRLPDSIRAGSHGVRSDIERRVELMGYRPWLRAMCRAKWKPAGEWSKPRAVETVAIASVCGLACSVAVSALVRGIYYLSLYSWPYTPGLVIVGTVVLAGLWTKKWSKS